MILLDSSFLIAFHNARDVHHASAATLMARIQADEWGNPVLLEYVFLELVTVLAARRNLDTAARVGRILLAAKEVTFIPCSEVFNDTWGTFQNQRDGALSFTDAALVAVARRREIPDIATFDQDFLNIPGIHVISA